MRMKQRLTGGQADGMAPSDFDPAQLSHGAMVELEHTDDLGVAVEIAMDNLAEDPDYYTKLEKVHAFEMTAENYDPAWLEAVRSGLYFAVERDVQIAWASPQIQREAFRMFGLPNAIPLDYPDGYNVFGITSSVYVNDDNDGSAELVVIPRA